MKSLYINYVLLMKSLYITTGIQVSKKFRISHMSWKI